MQTYWHCNKDSIQRLGYSPSVNVLALQQGQYTTIGILTQCKCTCTATRTVHNDWDTHPVQTYWHCNKDSTQRLGYSPSVNVLALQQGQYTTIGILTQCKCTCTATRTVHNDWDTHPVQTYWHCNKDSTQRLGYSPSANVLALQQGQYTTIGILIQCKRTGTATRPVHNDWDTHPVQTYWHCNKDSTQRLGYSSSANVLALQQGQYTTIGILIQCKRTGTATRTVYNDWDTHPVRTYWHYNKASIQRLGYSSSANVLALQQGQYTTIGILTQCERTGTATRPVYNDWDTHPVRTYWHCNKASTQRGILTQCERTGTTTRTVHNDWDTHPVRTYWHGNKDSTQRGILTQCERTGTTTRTVHNDWDTHPVQTYWHCNKDSIQRLGYSSSANVQALQQGQYTTIGILIQCERTGTATRPVHNDWDTHPVQTYWHCNKDSIQRLGYSSSANVLALQQGQYTTIGTLTQCERTGTATRPVYTAIGILTQCERTGTATRTVYNDWDTHPVRTYWHCNKASVHSDWDTHPVQTYWHCNKDSTQRLGYSSSANVLALQQGQYTTIGILIQCKRTGTATRTVHNDWDTHPVRTYWHCNKDSTQRLGYSSSANVLALQQGQYTTIGILIQCERTGTATRPVHNDWDTHPVRTYRHCNEASIQRLGYSLRTYRHYNQYTTIGILIQCERTGTTTRTVYNDWDTHPVQTYWHCNKDSTQRLGYSSSANVLALQQGQYTTIGILTQCKRTALQQGQYTTIGILTQCERTGTATRTVHNDWDTHPVQTYWHCNKDSTQRLGYSSSANVRTGTATRTVHTIGILIQCKRDTHSPSPVTVHTILIQCKRTGTATRTVHNDWDTHPV